MRDFQSGEAGEVGEAELVNYFRFQNQKQKKRKKENKIKTKVSDFYLPRVVRNQS